MIFKLDIPEQVQEAVFSGKTIATNHVTVYFNNVPVISWSVS